MAEQFADRQAAVLILRAIDRHVGPFGLSQDVQRPREWFLADAAFTGHEDRLVVAGHLFELDQHVDECRRESDEVDGLVLSSDLDRARANALGGVAEKRDATRAAELAVT